MYACDILWADSEIYQRRYEKTATALLAVEQVLRDERPLGGGEVEFLDLYRALASADAERFTQIWTDPFAYFWARLAYELLGLSLHPTSAPVQVKKYCAALGKEDPRQALAAHLDDFKKMVLGVEFLGGDQRKFRHPFQTTLPLSIPGSEYFVSGRGAIQIEGVAGSALDAVWQGRPMQLRLDDPPLEATVPRLLRCRSAKCGDYAVMLKPSAFNLPGIDSADAFEEVPDDFQVEQVSLVEDALVLIRRHQPRSFDHLSQLVGLIGLKPPRAGNYSNVSHSDLPGAFILSAVQEPLWIADALIHELHHNRLFFIQEHHQILIEPDEGDEQPLFYSPWRDDLRPMNGLLHATYVYIPVSRFWLSVWQSGETDGTLRAYVQDQAVRGVLQLRIGASIISRFAQFTDEGAVLFAEMQKEVDGLSSDLNRLRLSSDAVAMIARGDGKIVQMGSRTDGAPLSIVDTMRQHRAEFDISRQSDELETVVAAASLA